MRLTAETESELQQLISAHPGCHVQRFADGTGAVLTGDDIPQQPVPEVVTPWQIRKAINATQGMREQVEALLASPQTPIDVKDGWVVATEWRRDDAVLLAMVGQLGMNDAEIDALFRLAATL